MQFKTLALFFLSAGSLAFAAEEKRQLNDIPTSIEAVLATAIPESILANFPAVSAALVSSFEAGSYPGWYQSLPADVKTYLITAFGGGAEPTGVSASGNSAITPATTPSSGPSNTSGSSPVSSGSSGSSTSGSSGATNTGSSSSSSSSKAAAPAATAGIALGLAGAAGLFGVALIL